MSKNLSTTDSFFVSQKEKSRVKTIIVTEFFKAYFPIIYNTFKKDVWYLDLFAGPGMYEDGSKSTPIVLLDTIAAFKNDSIREHIKMVFNDHNKDYVSRLKSAVNSHPVIQKLRYLPEITCLEASDVDLSKYTNNNDPIFSFVDPWGYKDVSAAQVWKLVKNIGSDCVLFFNANRILQDINKPANEQDFIELFGESFPEAKQIQKRQDLSQRQKAEQFLILFSKNLYNTVRNEGNKKYRAYILPFCVEADDKETVSHYIVFISKANKAIQEMRRVMIKHGNSTSAALGYDDKDSMQIAFLSREDDLISPIIDIIKEMFSKYPQMYKDEYDVPSLSERLDDYSMYTRYNALPYSSTEVREAIEQLDREGHIDVIFPKDKQIKKRISQDRKFRIKKSIEEK